MLFVIAFGFCFDLTKEPPYYHFPSGELSEKALEELYKKVRDFRIHPCPKNFPKVIMPLFELPAATKTRLIHDCRFINLFLEIVSFSLPKAEDPLRFMDYGDFFFIMDFTGFWSQVPVCPESRRYFCASAKIKGQTRYFTYTGGSFGNCIMPFLAMLLLEHPCTIFNHFFDMVRYIDDICGGMASKSTNRETFPEISKQIDRFMTNLNIRRNNKTDLSAKICVEFLGKNLDSTDKTATPLARKIVAWVDEARVLVDRGTASLRNLSSIFGKFVALTNPVFAAYGNHLFEAISTIMNEKCVRLSKMLLKEKL